MKDSNKKSKKSSSDSVNPVKSTIPEMPKDRRTKAYKEWVKKYHDIESVCSSLYSYYEQNSWMK